jgi:hypothetical protein
VFFVDVESIVGSKAYFALHRLTQRMTKGAGGSYRLVYNVEESDDRFFLPGGLMFLKATQGMVKHSLQPLWIRPFDLFQSKT